MTADSHLRTIADLGLSALARRLPEGWTVRPLLEPFPSLVAPQEAVLCAPGRRKVHLRLKIARNLEPIDAEALPPHQGAHPLLVIAPSLSRDLRERLVGRGINLIDLSGNIRFSLTRPVLSLDVRAVSRGARRRSAPVRLTGSKTARVIRALCDFQTPTESIDVARQAGVGITHARRIVQELAREGLVVLSNSRRIESTDWGALLRRWSNDRVGRAGNLDWYTAPRGIGTIIQQLQQRTDCVVSGSWAANVFAPVASKQMLLCYVQNKRRFARELSLSPPGPQADVAVSSQYPDAVLERVSDYRDIRVAALSQIVADLMLLSLQSAADPLLEWMRDNEPRWRR